MTRITEAEANATEDALPRIQHDDIRKRVVKACTGFAFRVQSGSKFRVVDLYGKQVVDLMAWATPSPDGSVEVEKKQQYNYPSAAIRRPDAKHPLVHDDPSVSRQSRSPRPTPSLPLEKLSMAYTRYHLKGATPAIGECLYTNADKPLLKLVDDTCHVHDMTYMSCNPGLYDEIGKPGHPSCAMNIYIAMQPFGMRSLLEARATDPFNVFQNTPLYSLKALNSSRAGDHVEFEALSDCIVAVSCCPYAENGFNGGKVTDIAVILDL